MAMRKFRGTAAAVRRDYFAVTCPLRELNRQGLKLELSLKLVYAAWRRDGRRRWRLKENVASHGNTSTIELHHHGETYAGN
jgi:hypothetical protein